MSWSTLAWIFLVTDQLPQQSEDKGIEVRVMHQTDLVFIAGKRGSRKAENGLNDLLHRQDFIHYMPQNRYRWEVDQYFQKHQIEPSIMGEADDVYLILNAVREGLGKGVIPRTVLDEFPGTKPVDVIGKLPNTPELYVVFQNQNPRDEILAAVETLTEKDVPPALGAMGLEVPSPQN